MLNHTLMVSQPFMWIIRWQEETTRHSACLKARAHFHPGKEALILSRASPSYKTGTDDWPQSPRVGGGVWGRQLW